MGEVCSLHKNSSTLSYMGELYPILNKGTKIEIFTNFKYQKK